MNTQVRKWWVAGLLFFPLIVVTQGFSAHQSFAQESPNDIPPQLQALADRIGCDSQVTCKEAFNTNFTQAIEIADELGVYNADPQKKELAQSFKDEVLTQLQDVSQEEFEQKIVAIARDIVNRNKDLADKFSINERKVGAAELIVDEAKQAGVSVEICSRPANSLTKEELLRSDSSGIRA